MNIKTYSQSIIAASIVLLLSACGSSSLTNVWEYYVTNEVVEHQPFVTSVSSRKLLYQEIDKNTKSQLDMIAVKQDTNIYLVLGSYKMATPFVLGDSTYAFGLSDLYSRSKGDDLVGKSGDLTLFFTQIPASKCIEFLDSLEIMRKQYADAPVSNNATTQVDFYFSSNVFISLAKNKMGQQASNCTLWVGRRKHVLSIKECVKVLTEIKNFN
jgi:hypothetical protein